SIRSLRHSIFAKNIFSNKYLIIAVVLGFAFQLAAIYHPFLQKILRTVSLDIYDWSLIAFVCAAEIMLIESVKYFFIFKKK
ncbi:MAG: cation transporting ATPase C-terminal domain-containing protein, partial [Nanoarchaeota archaeon]|nr:cation transporting ATPase C-terminal domain-containing protein [Nanoarchaeota archaeon]